MNNSIQLNSATQLKWTNSRKEKLPKLTQEEIDNLNSPVSIK